MTKTGFAFRRITAASILLLGVSLGACSDDDDDDDGGGLPAATSYAGFVASTDGQTGPLSITFASPVAAPPAYSAGGTGPSFSSGAPVNATGTVSLGGGAPVPLTGTIDGGTLNMTGAGWTLTGSLLNGMITGTFTGPGGVTGSLSAVASAEGSPAQAFCGYYGGIDLTNETEVTGSFSLVIAGDVLLGTAVDEANEDPIDFAGTANQQAGTLAVDISDGNGGRLVVSGGFDGTGTSGTFDTYFNTVHVQTGEFYGYPDCEPI
jgi:hypothetical protein